MKWLLKVFLFIWPMEPDERYGNIATLIYCSTDCCLSIVVCC